MSRPALSLRAFAPARRLRTPFLFAPSRCLTTHSTTGTTPSSASATPSPQPSVISDSSNLNSSPPPSDDMIITPTTSKLPSTTTTTTASPLPYHITRTPSGNLAVYHEAKRGGNKKLTVIKKVAGDSHALRRDLVSELGPELGLAERAVRVNAVTGHVGIDGGHHKDRIAAWLESRGF